MDSNIAKLNDPTALKYFYINSNSSEPGPVVFTLGSLDASRTADTNACGFRKLILAIELVGVKHSEEVVVRKICKRLPLANVCHLELIDLFELSNSREAILAAFSQMKQVHTLRLARCDLPKIVDALLPQDDKPNSERLLFPQLQTLFLDTVCFDGPHHNDEIFSSLISLLAERSNSRANIRKLILRYCVNLHRRRVELLENMAEVDWDEVEELPSYYDEFQDIGRNSVADTDPEDEALYCENIL